MEEESGLLALPTELVLHILTYLEPVDLFHVATTCRALQPHSYDNKLWQPLVNRNLFQPINDPYPLKSFRDLYVAHHPHWFLPRHRIWFADSEPNGKLLIARYDPRRGCIEAYAVVAMRGKHTLEFWEKDPEVIIHSFDPKVSLDLNQAVLKLDVDSLRTNDQPNSFPSDRAYAPASRYSKETLMETFAEAGLYGSFMLCRSLPQDSISENTSVWPPLRFPADARVRNDSSDGFHSAGHRPSALSEVSEHNFRLRKWVEYTGRRSSPSIMSFSSPNGLSAALGMGGPYFASGMSSSGGGGMSIRMPEDITTYATLPESCYTPTKEKPWQGIWCGDYSGHGCEFLVVLQPDKEDERPLPEGMDWLQGWFRGGRRRGSASTDDSFVSAQEGQNPSPITPAQIAGMATDVALAQLMEYEAAAEAGMDDEEEFEELEYRETVEEVTDLADVPTGRLEAIKLTGDPNIPRGEYTFIAPDIGHGGFMRVADEEIFKGARVVRSAGHIAGRGFREGMSTCNEHCENSMLTDCRSIHALAAYHDLPKPPGAVLGRLWAYLVLPACGPGCADAGVSEWACSSIKIDYLTRYPLLHTHEPWCAALHV